MDPNPIDERSFLPKPVLIVGDIMLDRYWFGEVERISPEAPVPVDRKSTRLNSSHSKQSRMPSSA